jgi:uncharacterized protein (TIGR03437 family)
VSLDDLVTVSDGNGIVSATAILSSTGSAQVQVRVANLPVLTFFNLQGRSGLVGIAVLDGVGQEAPLGGRFTQPVIFQVYTAGSSAEGLEVQFTSAGVPVTISGNGRAFTDSSGRAAVSIMAGSTPGIALITATSGEYSVSFFLTVRALPPSALSVFNAYSGQPGAISPTEVLNIYGAGFAPGLQGCATDTRLLGPLPLTVSDVQVQFTSGAYSALAPIYSVCNLGSGQEYVVVQTPADLPLTEISVNVRVGGDTVAQSQIAVVPASPGIFEADMSDGAKRALLQRVDGGYVSLENPAQRGERLRVFVTGLGRPVTATGVLINTNQTGTTGDDAAPPNPVTLLIGNRTVQPVSSIYSTESIGVYVLTFDVPDDVQSGADVDFAVTTLLGDQNVAGKLSKLPVQ